MAKKSKELTPQQVIDIYASLDLFVTEDDEQIAAQVKKWQSFYTRRKNHTDPSVRHEATQWFKNVSDFEQRRQDFLEIVYQAFAQLSDAAVEIVSLEAGVLTPKLYSHLEHLALKQYCCDGPLARHFVERYLTENGYEIGNLLRPPHPIEQLTIDAQKGQIELNWRLPAENCDGVVLKRFETTKQGQFKKRGCILGQGIINSYVDDEVKPGQNYRYEVYSQVREITSETGVSIDAWAVGEVTTVAAIWCEDHVELSWQSPVPNCDIFVFRSLSPLEIGPNYLPMPQPADPTVMLVFRGRRSKWQDYDVQPGDTYHYLVVAYFAPGFYGEGVDTTIRVPHPPASVTDAQAIYKDGGIFLQWQRAVDSRSLKYVIVRRQGVVPASSVGDGVIVTTTRGTHYVDKDVQAGHQYSYTIFTKLNQIYSLTGAMTQPVVILAEVMDLHTKTRDGIVELHWHLPRHAERVIIRRHTNPPKDHTDGHLVNPLGATQAKDEGLTNGQRYHYLVCCLYRPDKVTTVTTPGVRIDARPEKLPDLIDDLDVKVVGEELFCTWTHPKHGQAIVLRSALPHDFPVGRRLFIDDIRHIGQQITSEPGHAYDLAPDISQPYYSIFSVVDNHVIVGNQGCGVIVPDVTDLSLTATNDGTVLQWTWPPDCHRVVIVRREHDWPQGLEDEQAVVMSCTYTEYLAQGGQYTDKVGPGHLFYVIYTQATHVPGKFFSPGATPGCRAAIEWQPQMVLRYRVMASKQKGYLRLVWDVEAIFPNFEGFVFIANHESPPTSSDDGIELYRWGPELEDKVGGYEVEVSLSPIQAQGWANFYGKVMVVNLAQRHRVLLIHPNTTKAIPVQGRLMPTMQPDSYHFGMPRRVICPYCFESFPPDEMLFASYDGATPQRARYSWLDRQLKRPLHPPKTKDGRLLTRKLCPRHQHDLPFSAGSQPSLVIGIIGAKFSGKSHYIASLVASLSDHVAIDFHADLRPVTDQTMQRYRQEFYEPLYDKRLELPATVGTPPPLIYDFSLAGTVWTDERPRGVTLALYDTAGENFDDPDTVRQMVRYLKVASGIIFLIDPLQSEYVRQVIPNTVPLPDTAKMAEPGVVINRVLTELEQGRLIQPSGRLDTPVAVVLTKCDVLRDVGLIANNRIWQMPKRHVGFFDQEIHEDMGGMMAEYMMQWSPQAYTTVKGRFSRYAFFGVSATGCAPDKHHRYRRISPWRVEEPLLWLLAELGVIPTQLRRIHNGH